MVMKMGREPGRGKSPEGGCNDAFQASIFTADPGSWVQDGDTKFGSPLCGMVVAARGMVQRQCGPFSKVPGFCFSVCRLPTVKSQHHFRAVDLVCTVFGFFNPTDHL